MRGYTETKEIRIEKQNREAWISNDIVIEACKNAGLKCKFVFDSEGFRVAWIEEPEQQHHASCYDTGDAIGFVRGYKFAKGLI